MKEWDRVQVRLSPEAKKFLELKSKPRRWSHDISSILEQMGRGELVNISSSSGTGLLERIEVLLRKLVEEEPE